jgi:predicted CopG family antitoxin
MREATMNITVPLELYRELKRLSLLNERSVSELIGHAVEIHYGDAAVSARHRLVDRLARLEAELGDQERLQEQIVEESRAIRAR